MFAAFQSTLHLQTKDFHLLSEVWDLRKLVFSRFWMKETQKQSRHGGCEIWKGKSSASLDALAADANEWVSSHCRVMAWEVRDRTAGALVSPQRSDRRSESSAETRPPERVHVCACSQRPAESLPLPRWWYFSKHLFVLLFLSAHLRSHQKLFLL